MAYRFFLGAVISTIGIVARTTLKETPEFADAKRRLKKSVDTQTLKKNLIQKERVSRKTIIACFFMYCGWPLCFYLTYIHCGNLLKTSFGFTAEQVIHQNLLVSIIGTLSSILLTFLSYKIYPLKILKIKLFFSIILVILCPYIFSIINSSIEILILQISFILFWATEFPATPILFKHFPVFKRFTYPSLLFALSRACMYIITSFGIVYTTKYYNNYGLLIVMIPIIIGYWFGLTHFFKLEKEDKNHLQSSENMVIF
ncbi:MAG: MFS transporter [Rickettsia endosymbiont of Argas persicus]